jgi:two-component system LytT family response regulator
MRVQPDVLPSYLRRESALVTLVWFAVGVVAILQGLIVAELGARGDLTFALLSRVSIVPLWAFATPLILRSARRWPIVLSNPTAFLPTHLFAHLASGALFVILANFAIQVTLLPFGVQLVEAALRDVAENFPAAIVVYLVIVALGHVPRAQAAKADCLTVKQWNRVHFVRLDDIDWIGAEDNYVVVYAAGRSYKGRERISEIAKQLDARRFVRIHRSTIVHVSKVREVQPLTHGDHAVVLRDGTQLRASRGRRAALGEALATTI